MNVAHILLLLSLNVAPPSPQDSLWVRGVTGRASMETRTQQEARAIALQHARDEAVKQAFGTSIASTFLVHQAELMKNGKVEAANNDAVQFILESADARVLQEKVLNEAPINVAREGVDPKYDYVVTIDAFVARERGHRDPDFSLDAFGIRASYNEGDKLIFEVNATKACYLNVFSFGADGLVYHVFPNAYDDNNRILGGVRRQIPGNSVYSLRMALPENTNASSETMLLVATMDSLVFRLGKLVKPGAEYVEMRRAVLQQLMEWIVMIPRDRRFEHAETYIIRK